jgi:hypothetical protein
MAYDIRLSGEIRIDPPIPADQLFAAGFPTPGIYGDKDIAVRVEEIPVGGVPDAYRRIATALVPCLSTHPAYQILEHLQEVVDWWGEGRTFAGRINCCDPHTGDLWRIQVRDRRAVKVTPRIVWPDSAEETSR